MDSIVTVGCMRDSDAFTIAHEVTDQELMRRAGHGIFENCPTKNKVAVVCGSGNNGGDGYACAIELIQAGREVDVFYTKEPSSDSSSYFYNELKKVSDRLFALDEYFEAEYDFSEYELILDCLLGTGFSGEPRGAVAKAIEAINKASAIDHAFVLSADINSGINGDTGLVTLAVQSDLTVSIGYFKIGMIFPAFSAVASKAANVNIGITLSSLPFRLADPSEMIELRLATSPETVMFPDDNFDFYTLMHMCAQARENDLALYRETTPRVLATPNSCYIERPFWLLAN